MYYLVKVAVVTFAKRKNAYAFSPLWHHKESKTLYSFLLSSSFLLVCKFFFYVGQYPSSCTSLLSVHGYWGLRQWLLRKYVQWIEVCLVIPQFPVLALKPVFKFKFQAGQSILVFFFFFSKDPRLIKWVWSPYFAHIGFAKLDNLLFMQIWHSVFTQSSWYTIIPKEWTTCKTYLFNLTKLSPCLQIVLKCIWWLVDKMRSNQQH